MDEFTAAPTTLKNGVGVSGYGVHGRVTEGAQSSARSRARSAVDPLEAALAAAGRGSRGLKVRAAVTLHVEGAERGASRAGGAAVPFDETPAVRVSGPGLDRGESTQIAVVEEEGRYTFVLPRAGTVNEFDVPVESQAAGERGFLQKIGQMAVRVIGVAGAKIVISKATELAVRRLEDAKRDYKLRPFRPDNCGTSTTESVDFAALSRGPSLLLIHGTNSNSHGGFRLSRKYVEKLHRRYSGRVFAFDHPTLSYSPQANAEKLEEILGEAKVRLDDVDIVAHSRGGLVARELVERVKPDGLGVRSVLFVASPNAGTPLADEEHLGEFISTTTNLMAFLPDNLVTDAIGIGLEVLKDYVLGAAFPALEGIAAMNPRSDYLSELNGAGDARGDVTYRAIASNYEPSASQGALRRARDHAMDVIFAGRDNDLWVPTRSVYAPSGEFSIGSESRLVLDPSFGVDHSTFWTKELVEERFDQWLDPAITIDAAKSVADELTDPAAEFEGAVRTGKIATLIEVASTLSSPKRALVEKALGGPIADLLGKRDEAAAEAKGTVVVIPGIMGSSLAVNGDDVWLNPWQLLRGRFRNLHLNGTNVHVAPTGLLRQYAPLLSHLARSWDVVTFPYDWRADIAATADRLAERMRDQDVALGEQPVHFVAHSMGGLVVRSLIARHPDLWKQARGRLVQLGTPNWGSFAIPTAFSGEDFLLNSLAFADTFHSKEELVATVASFPGAYQLMPSPDREHADGGTEHASIYDHSQWGSQPVRQDLLDDARQFQKSLAGAVDPDRFVYIAGDGHRTPARVRVDAPGELSFGITDLGDGRVAHAFGHEGLDIQTYFVGAKHGDLISDGDVLGALDELIVAGATDRLRTEPASRRAAREPDQIEWVPAGELETRLGNSMAATRGGAAGVEEAQAAVERAAAQYVGGGATASAGIAPLRVTVVHGSLEQALHPVASGWYKGLPTSGAVRFIDGRFKGRLRDYESFGLLPEQRGTALYVEAAEDVWPKGAIILGLGEFGDLTPTVVTDAMALGTIQYALDARRKTPGGKPSIGVSAVLVGAPGRYGLGIEASLRALVTGVARASKQLQLEDLAVVDQLEIIELYAGPAEQAATTLLRFAKSPTAATLDVRLDAADQMESRPGGRPGSGAPSESGQAWPRYELEFEDELGDKDAADPSIDNVPGDSAASAVPTRASEVASPGDRDPAKDAGNEVGAANGARTLRFIGLSRRAQADHLSVLVDVPRLKRLVQTAVKRSHLDPQINNTLYELLFPNEAKLQLDDVDNFHVLVDESTAWIPWEVLAGRDNHGDLQPLALRTGLLRQLKPRKAGTRVRMPGPRGMKALVIGDPPGGRHYPRLSGARQEAEAVAAALGRNGYNVRAQIYSPEDEPSTEIADSIRNALFAEPYRVIHIAAHGDFAPNARNPLKSGVVIGDGERLHALDFAQRGNTPDLVFLNCCHVGRIDDYSQQASETHSRFSDLASSLALQLLRSGVRAVVAAGWAVGDAAAEAFAATFYERLLGGDVFGDAVRDARQAAHEADGGRTNTWGAYQCYGDPGFEFYNPNPRRRHRPTYVSSHHLITDIEAQRSRAGLAGSPQESKRIAADLAGLEERWLSRYGGPDVLQALGTAYSEAGDFDRAVHAYRRALAHPAAQTSLKTVETLANLEARLAAVRHRSGGDKSTDVTTDTAFQLFASAKRHLEWLLKANVAGGKGRARTPERLAIYGSFYKKRATTQKRAARRHADIRHALARYEEACSGSRKGDELSVYHAALTLIMAGFVRLDPDHGLDPEQEKRYDGFVDQLLRQKELIDTSKGGYYVRVRPTDIDASIAIYRGDLKTPRTRDAIIKGFTQAFTVRSTAKQRLSVIDNYRDLADLYHAAERTEEGNGATEIADALEAFRPRRA